MCRKRKFAWGGVVVFNLVTALLMLHDLLAQPKEKEVPITIQVTPTSLSHARHLCEYARESQVRVNVPLSGFTGSTSKQLFAFVGLPEFWKPRYLTEKQKQYKQQWQENLACLCGSGLPVLSFKVGTRGKVAYCRLCREGKR